jgi:CBS domain-containing protein
MPRETTLRNAVSLMLETNTDRLVVIDGETVLGTLSLSNVGELL